VTLLALVEVNQRPTAAMAVIAPAVLQRAIWKGFARAFVRSLLCAPGNPGKVKAGAEKAFDRVACEVYAGAYYKGGRAYKRARDVAAGDAELDATRHLEPPRQCAAPRRPTARRRRVAASARDGPVDDAGEPWPAARCVVGERDQRSRAARQGGAVPVLYALTLNKKRAAEWQNSTAQSGAVVNRAVGPTPLLYHLKRPRRKVFRRIVEFAHAPSSRPGAQRACA